MFGLLGFIVDLLFALFPLLVVIVGFVHWRWSGKARNFYSALAFGLIIGVLWLPVMGSRLYYKTTNYLVLRSLNSQNVVSIEVDTRTWNEPQDIGKIVSALDHPIWHVVNHDVGGPYLPMTITLRSGDSFRFRIGQHHTSDGVLIEFFRPANDNGATWEDGDAFIPELPRVLKDLNYVLPVGAW